MQTSDGSHLLSGFSEMSGTAEDISQVHWKQQWLENGTLYFHVSMTESELMAQTTQTTAREPAHVLHEHMHLLHISVMVSLLWFSELQQFFSTSGTNSCPTNVLYMKLSS